MVMNFENQFLKLGDTGPLVEEVQLRLAGFQGSVWDGVFGTHTELQVQNFQKDYMKRSVPSKIVDAEIFAAILEFSQAFPIDFNMLPCPDCRCPGQGFGQNRFANEYLSNHQGEQYHKREYPGIHKAILYTYQAAQFYLKSAGLPDLTITSGYRCWLNNEQKGRKSTNHMGKALDCVPMLKSEGHEKRKTVLQAARSILIQKCGFQMGWSTSNTKSLEPPEWAPTWLHMDVRSYAPQYLADRYFVKTGAELLEMTASTTDEIKEVIPTPLW